MLVVALGLVVLGQAAGAAARRPNILFVMADDLGWMDLACQGNPLVETPNIDRLARQGMRFTSAYAAAPVCSPTRAAVLTVQGDRVRGWRFVGFGPTLDEDEARQVDLAFGEAGIVGRAVVTGDACSVVSGPNGVPRDAEPAFTTLPLGVHALAVPVLVGGQVMAVVYGDDAERRPAAAWRESLEVLARHAGHCLEALTALRAAQLALQDVESFFPENAGPTLPFDEGGVERPKPEA